MVRRRCPERGGGGRKKLLDDPGRRLVVKLAKAMNRFPHEVERCTPDEFWELVAEFKLESDEWEEQRNK